MIIVTVFIISRVYNTGNAFSALGAVNISEVSPIVETSNKPIVVSYNGRHIEYKDGVAIDVRTGTPVKGSIRNVGIDLGEGSPHELKINFPYKEMRVVNNRFGKRALTVFQSGSRFHPGDKFIVKEPHSTVILYL